MPPDWAKPVEGGIAIAVRLTPKSSRDAIDCIGTAADGRTFLKARVRAAPEDGKANAALEAMIAKSAGVPKSRVAVVSGHAARLKTVRIACEPEQAGSIAGRLAGAVSP